MSPFALLSLLSLGLFAAVIDTSSSDTSVDDNDESAETPETEAPEDETIDDLLVSGTEGNDTLQASEGQTVNGLAGDDVLTENGGNSVLNGGAGNDTLDGDGNVTLNGGEGNDSISIAAEAGSNSSVDGGAGDDSILAQGTIVNVTGGDGNDTITSDALDSGGGTPIFGEAGDDLLIAINSPGFQIGTSLDGGLGDDTLQTETFLNSSDSYDTLTGGDGADTFDLNFPGVFPSSTPFSDQGDVDVGVVTTVTDFVPGEDVLDLSDAFTNVDNPTTASVSFVEAEDASFTDVIFTATPTNGTGTITGTIRLDGTTNLTQSDVILPV